MNHLDELAMELALRIARGVLRDARGESLITHICGGKETEIRVTISTRTKFTD